MKIQSINQSSPRLAENKANNKQQNFKGLVKLIDIGGEKLVMDAKKSLEFMNILYNLVFIAIPVEIIE